MGLVLLLCTAVAPVAPSSRAESIAPVQLVKPNGSPHCTQLPRPLEFLARDLVYRSHTYAAAGEFHLAARSLARALHMRGTVTDPFAQTDLVATIVGESGGQPSTMEQILENAVKTQEFQIALDLLPPMVEATQVLAGEYGVINQKRAILIRLAHYYTLLEQPHLARSLLDQATQLLNSLQGDGFGLIAAPIANGYAAIGAVESAIEILDQAVQFTEAMTTDDSGYLSDIFSAIALAYAQTGDPEQALAIARRIPVTEKRATVLATIARNPFDPAIVAEALALAQTMTEASRSRVFAPLSLAYAVQGQWDAAIPVAESIVSAEVKVQTLGELAAIDTAASRPEIRDQLFDQIVKTVQTLIPFYDGDRLLREIIHTYLDDRRYELAWELAQKLDLTLKQEVLLKLMEAARADGAETIAQQAAAMILPGGDNPTVIPSPIPSTAEEQGLTSYLKTEQYELALQQVQGLENNYDHDRALFLILTQMLEVGDWALVEQSILPATQAIRNPPQQVAFLVKIADYSQAMGQLPQAAAILDQAFAIVQPWDTPDRNSFAEVYPLDPSLGLEDEFDRGSLLESIALRYATLQQYDRAQQVAQALRSPLDRDHLMQSLTCYRP